MNPRIPLLAAAAALATAGLTGCANDYSNLSPARGTPEPVVYSDGFAPNVTFQAFLGTKLDAVQETDNPSDVFSGSLALEITIPALNDPDGNFAGGAFTTDVVRDLAGFDALTFWAKATRAGTLSTAGFANDNTGTSLYEASTEGLELTTSWQKYVLPIPLPEKLDLEGGLFFFAEALEVGEDPYVIHIDEIVYERTGIVGDPRPFMPPGTLDSFVGATLEIQGTRTTMAVSGDDILMNHSPNYFTYLSSDESVAVAEGSVVTAVGGGSATVTGKLGTVDVTGAITVQVEIPPDNAPPVPTVPAGDVISLISNNTSYPEWPVDRWSADFDQATVTDLVIGGAPIKAYTYEAPNYFSAIEFISSTINATSMTHLHLDVWLPEGQPLLVKLVDFGDDGIYNPPDEGPGDDSESSVIFLGDPPLQMGAWTSLEIPLADFTDLNGRTALAQIILQRTGAFPAYVTNIYFHR